ncbi:MAG: GNAT family N-acetyltransferase [Clostridia bacterium]|nr:GNAT family N-acetyltransferase [Clostridia bacterium]
MTLTTERCTLFPLAAEHIPELIPLFTSPKVRRYLGGVISPEAAEEKLFRWIWQKNSHYWTVRLTDGDCIGLVNLSPHHDPAKTELSYQFLPVYWGQGYAAEVLTAVLDWCRGRYTFVVSETQEANVRSCRLLERLGYRLTGRLERYGAMQRLYEKEISG